MECSELMRPKNNYIKKNWLNQFKNNKVFGHNIYFAFQMPTTNPESTNPNFCFTKFCVFFYF